MEHCYWERWASKDAAYPEEGGMLDQDEFLMTDIGVYAWLVSLAEKALDDEDDLRKLAEKQRQLLP